MLVLTRVCRFASYRIVWVVRTGPSVDRYMDRLLSDDPLDVAPYRIIRGCSRLVTTRNRSVTVDFDRRRLPSGNISLATARKREKKREKKQGRRKRKRKKKRETYAAREPRDSAADEENLARWQLLRRGLLLV
ncbi:hypothetical protein B296_00023208 [Ensete ventricosum]|uniref:Uncharacterized protein n=1 Tax=Ensete ventricosum TaxID=4639 RepID=A0A426ZBK6_ENSVE|nr:hypothetical protein B296_00023208 [Ensete ventricosum]